MRVRTPIFVLAAALCLPVGYGVLPTSGAGYTDKQTGTITITVDIPATDPSGPSTPPSSPPAHLPADKAEESEGKKAEVPEAAPTSIPPPSATAKDSVPAESETQKGTGTMPAPTPTPTETKEASDEVGS